jgi:hypothetical protein
VTPVRGMQRQPAETLVSSAAQPLRVQTQNCGELNLGYTS